MTAMHLPSSSCTPFPGLAADSSGEAQEPGGWLHPEAQESRNLILRVNDAESEPSLSRLRGIYWVPVCLSTLVLVGLLALGSALAVSLDVHSRAKPELRTKFLLVGDWGREGGLNQSEVARAMSLVASVDKPDFVVSTGDNFYESGLTYADDTQFDTSFSSVYGAPSLQGIPWHAVLGNHDYGEVWTVNASTLPRPPECSALLNQSECHFGPLHQLDVRLAARDARWHCERWFSLRLLGGAAELFFIDTSPGVLEYRTAPWAGNPGGILSQSWEAQLLELEARLAASSARMKLVVGHHPVRSNGQGEYPEIRTALQPLLECYGVSAYLCGHEHNLQHLHADGDATHYIVSGGGSKAAYATHSSPRNDLRMFHQGSGFVACDLSERALDCQYHGIGGTGVFYAVSVQL